MRLVDRMADKIRDGFRSFLRIEPAQKTMFQITENLDFFGNAVRNRIWYRGDADELSAYYKQAPGASNRLRFWAAVPTSGRDIEKIHTGLAGIIADTLTSIVVSDINTVEMGEGFQKYEGVWKDIAKDNTFNDLLSEAISETLIVGDGAFRVSLIPSISKLPLIEFIPGDRCDYHYERGRLREIEIRTKYHCKTEEYILHETYGYGYLQSELTRGQDPVDLNSIPDTAGIAPEITWDDSFMLAIPLKFFKSKRYKGRGGSIFDSKADNFDSFDEIWSQWMDAIRKARTKEYIPSNMLPRNPLDGTPLKPSAFDNAYIEHDAPMGENTNPKIEVVQPEIPHESYLATYVTALDLCLQGIISPSTLGIDVKKLDNADAQREKEKATLYTRNKIVEALQETVPKLVDIVIKANNTWMEQPTEDIDVNIPFGEYANPSFESQVETVGKAKAQGIMSIEAVVEELYGDTKDDAWKQEEIQRMKEEQGVAPADIPSVNAQAGDFTVQTDTGGMEQ